MYKIILLLIVLSNSVFADIPDKGSFLIEGTGHISFLFGEIVNYENQLSSKYGLEMIYNNTTGNKDTLNLKYSYFHSAGDILLVYHLSNGIGMGFNYNRNAIIQNSDFPSKYKVLYSDFLSYQKIGTGLNISYSEKAKIYLSNYLSIHYCFGNIQRIGLFANHLKPSNADHDLFKNISEPQPLAGIGIGINQKVNVKISDNISMILGLKYDFTHIEIEKDIFIYQYSTSIQTLGGFIGLCFFTY